MEHTYDKSLKIEDYGEIGYCSKKVIKKLYPNGGFKIAGAVGSGFKNQEPLEDVIGEGYPAYPFKYNKALYYIDGYRDCNGQEYIAIIKPKGLLHILTYLCVLVLLASLSFGGFKLWERYQLGLDETAVKFESQLGIPDYEEGTIVIPGYDIIEMKGGTDTATVALWNPDVNPCYFKFHVLDEGGNQLFETGLVPPGKAVTTVEFPEAMEIGEYPITIRIDSFSLDDGKTQLNGGEIQATLVALP